MPVTNSSLNALERCQRVLQRRYFLLTGAMSRAANDACRTVVRYILTKNILCGDALTMKPADGSPIIFAEGLFIDGRRVKRRDFRLDQLINCDVENRKDQYSLGCSGLEYSPEQHCCIPLPIRESPPTDYRRLWEHD